MRVLLFAAVLAGVTTLAGCGDSSKSPPAAAGGNAGGQGAAKEGPLDSGVKPVGGRVPKVPGK